MNSVAEHTAAWLLARVIVVAAGLLAVALIATSTTSSAGSSADIPSAVREAVVARQTVMILPSVMRPGHLSTDDVTTLKANVRTSLGTRWGGTALTNVLSNTLDWVARIATNPTEGYAISFELLSIQLDPPIVANGTATVTGTYTFIEKQGYGLPDGRTATYGGTYTNRFAFQLQHGEAGWYVSDYTDQQIKMEPNPSFEANLDVDPNPAATKPPVR